MGRPLFLFALDFLLSAGLSFAVSTSIFKVGDTQNARDSEMDMQSEVQSRADEARNSQGTTVKDGSGGEPKYTGESPDPHRGSNSGSMGSSGGGMKKDC